MGGGRGPGHLTRGLPDGIRVSARLGGALEAGGARAAPTLLSPPRPHDPKHWNESKPTQSMTTEIVTVRPGLATATLQRLPNFVGISEATAGATGISMNLVVIPPAGQAEPHLHLGFETAIYLLKGRVETRYGEKLSQSVVNREGDFIFIPAGVPHQPRNLSDREPALAIVARNNANEQETVQLYQPQALGAIDPGRSEA